MSRRFNSRIGGGVLIGLAAIYMVASLALGKSATAEPPPDLSLKAADAGVDVMKGAAAAIDGATFVDVRPASEFAAYHIPGSVNVPDASAADLRSHAGHGAVIVVAARDDAAQKLTGAARAADPAGKYFFLSSGVRDWYLAFELPVSLFNEKAPPSGYGDAVTTLKQYMRTHDQSQQAHARIAILDLARMNYQPTMLGTASKAKSAAGPRKKISGGCGG